MLNRYIPINIKYKERKKKAMRKLFVYLFY
jgi:hypothetical protein